ncbi:carboxylate--amine ligase [Blastococcus mobilis]|uniref:carboxylate--amine ligase n=1 Tax=Blastococcus mobilis TaxID=1938746 RepID=UPI001131523E|nr:ATP-grasp domain-containing protein [Blastococcus mobilis]
MEIVRALALAGVPSAVVAPRHDEARYSRYATTIFDWDWGLPIEECGEQLLERLLEFGRRQSEPPVLFFCSDQAVMFTSRFRTRLEPTFRFAVASPDLVEDVSDKQRFSSLSARLSLPVPATRVVESAQAFADAYYDAHLFPLIVKPALRSTTWASAEPAKALRVDDLAELRALAQTFRASEQRFVVQECVPGPESAIESYHVYVDGRGSVRAEFTGRKIRTMPAEFGHSTALTLTAATDVRDLGRELVTLIGLRGVAKFDFKRSARGKLYLLEINARFSLWHHLGARVGVNIPAMVYADLTGGRWVSSPTERATAATWVHPKDVLAARRAGVPMLRWLIWAARCDAKAFWAWNDPLPLLAACGAWIREHLPTTGRRSSSHDTGGSPTRPVLMALGIRKRDALTAGASPRRASGSRQRRSRRTS